MWVVPLLWSSNYIIARLADGVIAPHALALGRWALAAALLLPFVAGTLRTHGKLMLMAPSYDRHGTVGFRCAADV